jgi:hypothetical protein
MLLLYPIIKEKTVPILLRTTDGGYAPATANFEFVEVSMSVTCVGVALSCIRLPTNRAGERRYAIFQDAVA